jgi:hypothetical protein
MDFDPEPIFAEVCCPTLLFYGEDDEWAPAEESIQVWRCAARAELTVVRLAEATHHPTLNGGRDIATISPVYMQTIMEWIEARLQTAPHLSVTTTHIGAKKPYMLCQCGILQAVPKHCTLQSHSKTGPYISSLG